MKIFKYPTTEDWQMLTQRPAYNMQQVEDRVLPILEEVKSNGDRALKKFSEQFDKVSIDTFLVSEEEIKEAESKVSEELKKAIIQAKDNIQKFHLSQKIVEPVVEVMEGIKCWRKSLPIEKVGLYIPGGTAPLFSTVLMLAIPAKIAGCKEIILCTPPNKEGGVHPAILYAASVSGVSRIFKVGGAQAIAAMAFGTESIPQTYKIFGPGNTYVTAAKQLISRWGTAIDMPAGPSEVLVIGDETSNPAFVASDLLSQAEHGADSQVILLSTSEALIEQTLEEIKIQTKQLTRSEVVEKALQNSRCILLKDISECIRFSNQYAPEHLILSIDDAEKCLFEITNAGSVFIGHFSPESAGDYASGTNHTLPTNGAALAYNGASLDSFYKKVTFQKLSFEGLKNIGKTVEIMAEAEGLDAHKNAITIRLTNNGKYKS